VTEIETGTVIETETETETEIERTVSTATDDVIPLPRMSLLTAAGVMTTLIFHRRHVRLIFHAMFQSKTRPQDATANRGISAPLHLSLMIVQSAPGLFAIAGAPTVRPTRRTHAGRTISTEEGSGPTLLIYPRLLSHYPKCTAEEARDRTNRKRARWVTLRTEF